MRYGRVSHIEICDNQKGDVECTYANDGLRSDQLDMAVLKSALGVALAIGLEVAKVTHVAILVCTVTVCLVVGVD